MGIGNRSVWRLAGLLEAWGLKMAPGTETASLYRAIGELTSEVRALRRESQQAAASADAERASVRDKLDGVDRRTYRLEGDLTSMSKKLERDVYPIIEKVRRWEQRTTGGMAVAVAASSGVTMLVASYGKAILGWLGG